MFVGPNTPSVLKDGTWTDRYQINLKVYKGYLLPQSLKAVVYNFKDVQWAGDKLASFPETDPGIAKLPSIECTSDQQCGSGNQGLMPNSLKSVGQFGVGPNAANDPYFNSGGIAVHEFTHAIQGAQYYNGDNLNDGNQDNNTLTPCWLTEGQPNYTATGTWKTLDEYRQGIQTMFIGHLTNYLKNHSPDSINAIFQNSFPGEQCRAPFNQYGPQSPYQMSYSVGMFAVQILAAIGGVDSTMALETEMSRGLTFPEAFQAVYGISWSKGSYEISQVISNQMDGLNIQPNFFMPGPTVAPDGTVS